MIKILVPVDFTKVSYSAFQYANHLADTLNAEICLFHVINGSFSTADSMFLDTMDAAQESAEKRLSYFADEYKANHQGVSSKIRLTHVVRFGVPGFTIADYANDNQFDYVVAGTRDNHSILERILGTTSTIITKLTSCPVILIHENTRWMVPKKIIFTLDDSTDFDESIEKFLAFNSQFKAATDFIHIKVGNEKMDHTLEMVLHEVFKTKEPDFAFQVKNIHGGDIVQSIVDYSIFEKADMLVMVHRKKSFLGDLFDKSVSLKTVEGIHLPIMILEENPPSQSVDIILRK